MAPAGSLKSYVAAVYGGADAVYLGFSKFNARKPADNFDRQILEKVVKHAHSMKVKVYVVVNILIKPNELIEVVQLVKYLDSISVDGLIVTDPALFRIINQDFPGLPLFLSTQLAVLTKAGVNFAGRINASRVVMAREVEFDELRAITEESEIDIEIFTEGSMCFSISGRCLMSGFVGGRSGNRGTCTAPCRVMWQSSNESFTFFSMKDLTLKDYIKEFVDIKIASLKIEGRLKSPDWVYGMSSLYRALLDTPDDTEKIDYLNRGIQTLSARESGTGHLLGHDELTGSNAEWDSYKKERFFDSNYDTSFADIEKRIEIKIETSVMKIHILNDRSTDNFEIKLPHSPKKAKTQPLSMIKDLISPGSRLSGYEFELSLNDIDKYEFSIKQLTNIINEIEQFIRIFEKNILDFEELDEKLYSKYSCERKFSHIKKLSSGVDSLIVFDYQLKNLKLNPDLNLIIELTEISYFPEILKLKEKFDIVLSVSAVIFESERQIYSDYIERCISNGFKRFEASSFTGFEILSLFDCEKSVGCDFPVMNHIAASFFYDEHFKSVYASSEVDFKTLKLITESVKSQIKIVDFAYPSLFVARVNSENYDSQRYKDKLGVGMRAVKVGGRVHFVSDTPFYLSRHCKASEISTDSVTVDLRFSDNVNRDINYLIYHKGSLQTSGYNINRKFV